MTSSSIMHLLVRFTIIASVILLVLVCGVNGHFSFVHKPSQIACNWDDKDGSYGVGGRIDWLAHPILSGAPFSDWWLHGQVNCQNKTTGVFELPANGRTAMVMSSRVQYAPEPYGNGIYWTPSDPDYVFSAEEWIEPLDDKSWGKGNYIGGKHNIHSYTRDDTSGCALAIAYKSNVLDVNPKDFVIFTVVHDCPKRMREYIDIPNLPACPDGNCICAWFWNPKNSGTKNFYMTPFVCDVTGADPNASPVDIEYAIPPRRCLDPTNCNFGPRNPMYYLGEESDEINMAEPEYQSPHYSIIYGFREGAQHDIFVNTNPRRYRGILVNEEEPSRCDNGEVSSRLSEYDAEQTSWVLKSSNCKCAAELKNGVVNINILADNETTSTPTNSPTQFSTDTEEKSLDYVGNNGIPYEVFPLSNCQGDCDRDSDCAFNLVCFQRDGGETVPGCLGGNDDYSKSDYCVRPSVFNSTEVELDVNHVWQHYVTSTFGPMDVVDNTTYKAGSEYFPLSYGPYRLDLNDECYLYVTSADGVVVWESPVLDDHTIANMYVIDTFTGQDPDPDVWPPVIDYTDGKMVDIAWSLRHSYNGENVRRLRGSFSGSGVLSSLLLWLMRDQ